MKALSIQQPFADLIVDGIKDVENRTWALPSFMEGRRIYIHAGRRMFNRLMLEDAMVYYNAITHHYVEESKGRRGGIVGEATLVRGVTKMDSEWFVGPHGFVLKDPVRYDQIVPCRGALGFFSVPEAVQARAMIKGETR